MRVLAALMGGLALYVGCQGLWGSWMAGFPDGHLTPYDRAVKQPFAVLSWLSIVSSLYFFTLLFTAARPRGATKLLVGVFAYVLCVPGTHWVIEYSLKHFTGIDHGQGG